MRGPREKIVIDLARVSHTSVASQPSSSLGFARLIPTKPKVTSERVAPRLRKASRRLYPIPQRYILLADDFGRQRILVSPLPGLQVPVVSAYTRAKDSVTTVRCPTRSPSQIRQSQASRCGGIF